MKRTRRSRYRKPCWENYGSNSRLQKRSVVVKMLFERVLIFLVLLGFVLRQTALAFGLYAFARQLFARHAGRREQLLQVAALAGRARRRGILRAHQGFEFVLARAALVFV